MTKMPLEFSRPLSWQDELKQSYKQLDKLLADLKLNSSAVDFTAQKLPFRTLITRSFARRMACGDAQDPLLLQVMPTAQELIVRPGESADPVGDLAASQAGGIIHKYAGRILLVMTGACAIHCRYCFRREFPYGESLVDRRLASLVEQIERDDSIREVILSGGDPLMLSDDRLSELVARLENIAHLKTLRIHTRLPVVLPQRVDSSLLSWIARTRLKVVMVIHCNHGNELDGEVASALAALADHRVMLLNQSVLLKGVNDSSETLAELSWALFEQGVLPYYLHQLDRARGTGHFEVEQERAILIRDELLTILPGYLVPRLVQELPGRPSKVPL